ncbi:hypothetical protein [Bacillus shivajii]|nr:hypothetical protein [Bacillus shivajii]
MEHVTTEYEYNHSIFVVFHSPELIVFIALILILLGIIIYKKIV